MLIVHHFLCCGHYSLLLQVLPSRVCLKRFSNFSIKFTKCFNISGDPPCLTLWWQSSKCKFSKQYVYTYKALTFSFCTDLLFSPTPPPPRLWTLTDGHGGFEGGTPITHGVGSVTQYSTHIRPQTIPRILI